MFLELADRLGSSDSGDDVLALSVDQIIAEELVCPGVGVASEGDTGTGIRAGVAEDHRLHVHRRALEAGDPLDPTVLDCFLTHPASEDRHDGLPELLLRILRKRLPDVFFVDRLVAADELLQVCGVELGIKLHAALFLEARELVLERFVLDAHGGRSEHVDQAPIAVQGESSDCRSSWRGPRRKRRSDRDSRSYSSYRALRAQRPDRTLTRRGSDTLPNFLPAWASIRARRLLDLRLDFLGKTPVKLVILERRLPW